MKSKEISKPVGNQVCNQVCDQVLEQIKENEETLSDYLLQYQKMTGSNEIEGDDGETRIIVNIAKLVKGSFKPKS